MTTKIKSISVISARIVLGLIYFVFGLNFFLNFLPTPPQTGGLSETFIAGLWQSGYFFPFLKGIEVILGAALLAGIFIPLVLVILMPISLNILLFHVFLTDDAMVSIVIVALHLYLAWAYREYYKTLFYRQASATL